MCVSGYNHTWPELKRHDHTYSTMYGKCVVTIAQLDVFMMQSYHQGHSLAFKEWYILWASVLHVGEWSPTSHTHPWHWVLWTPHLEILTIGPGMGMKSTPLILTLTSSGFIVHTTGWCMANHTYTGPTSWVLHSMYKHTQGIYQVMQQHWNSMTGSKRGSITLLSTLYPHMQSLIPQFKCMLKCMGFSAYIFNRL